MAEIIINDEPHQIEGTPDIASLLRFLGIGEGEVAVEYNLAIVPASRWKEVKLHDGDKIEIVRFVGGG